MPFDVVAVGGGVEPASRARIGEAALVHGIPVDDVHGPDRLVESIRAACDV